MTDIFSPASLKVAVDKLAELPPEEGEIGAVVTKDDQGVEGSIAKRIGRSGASVGADASWMRRAGWRVAAMFQWKGDNR